MHNLENLDVFEILITQKLLKCLKDPFLRSALICMYHVIPTYYNAVGITIVVFITIPEEQRILPFIYLIMQSL